MTDAWYVKPTLRWDMLPGLRFDAAVIYSRAIFSQSTPSSTGYPVTGEVADKGDPNLGVELDTGLTYTSGDGFQAFVQWGVLQPLGGLSYNDAKMSRAQFLSVGLAAKF